MAKTAAKTAAKSPAAKTTPTSAKVKAKNKADIDQDVEDEEDLEDEENQTGAEGDDDTETGAEGDTDEDKSAEGDDTETDDEKKTEDETGAEGDDMEEGDKPASKKSKATGERGRIAAILQSNAAKGRTQLAEHLAFETDMSPKAAIAALKVAPRADASAGNDFRKAVASGNPTVGGGAAAKLTGDAAEVAETLALAKKAGLA